MLSSFGQGKFLEEHSSHNRPISRPACGVCVLESMRIQYFTGQRLIELENLAHH